MSKLFVDEIVHQSSQGSGTITIGASGESITVPNGSLTGQNYPAFEAFLSVSQSIPNDTVTKCNIDTEVFDTDSCYDNSVNYRFTPNVAGKYFIYGQVYVENLSSDTLQIRIYKNGSILTIGAINTGSLTASNMLNVTTMDTANGSSDYYELYCYQDSGSSTNLNGNASSKRSFFGAFRIGA